MKLKYCNAQEKYETDETEKEFLDHQDSKYKGTSNTTNDEHLKEITHNA